MKQIVYLNGNLIPLAEAFIPVTDYGFLFGYGLFETMRAYNGQVFRLDSHLVRLKKSAEMLGIQVDITVLKTAITDTVTANKLKDARVRLTISSGAGSPSPDPGTCKQPTVLIIAMHYTPYPQEIYERGFHAIVSASRRNSQSSITRMKTTNYLEHLLSKQEAKTAGVDDVVYLNEKGQLAEASSSNIFCIKDRILKTPRIESGILPGITRDVVLELASGLGIEAMETDITLDELSTADEAFLSNSVMEIMPLTELAGRAIGTGTPGTITKRFIEAYKAMVISETR